MRILLLLAALAAAVPGFAQQDVEDARRGVASVEALLKQRPDDPTLHFYLARFQAAAGNRAASIAELEKVLATGNGFLPTREGFGKVWDDPAFQALRAKLDAKEPRLDYAPVAYEIDDRTIIPEGIAYDAHSQAVFLGSIAQRKIFRINAANRVSEFAGTGTDLDSILGLAVDSPRRVLYAVSTSALTAAGEARRRNAVVAFDIDSGRFLRRMEVAKARQLNDVAVAPGGRVFTTDSASGAIYEVLKEGDPRELVGPNVIRGSNGLAVSPDSKRLYVAHSTGIVVVDVATGAVKRVPIPAHETVAAIDGLYEWQGQLIGVQNITTPGRVILMTLSPDGSAITRVQTLLSHHHNRLDEPTTGAVTPRGFYLLAATGVGHFDREGKIERPDSVPSPTILRIPLPR